MAYFPPLCIFFAFVAIAISGSAPTFEVPVARPYVVLGSQSSFSSSNLAPSTSRTRSTLQYLEVPKLKALYNIPTSNTLGVGKTIALIDAYGASTAEADLGVFSTRYGLPQATTANGLFKKVDQNGGTNYPPDDTTKNWALETALDVQSVHAFAPGAKILLVVCNSDSFSDLLTGVNYAKANADYISMSWGAQEGSYISSYEPYFANSLKSFFASTGDNGTMGGISYPASSANVVAVGGTSLYTNTDYTLAAEQGWGGSGGGCSAFTTAVPAQTTSAGYSSLGCGGKKALPDMSMDADPVSGLVIYLSQSGGHGSCTPPNCLWIAGGTSLSSPLAAARGAIRGVQITPAYIYTSTIVFRDITTGSNGGHTCAAGLDLVTGRGSWVGAS